MKSSKVIDAQNCRKFKDIICQKIAVILRRNMMASQVEKLEIPMLLSWWHGQVSNNFL